MSVFKKIKDVLFDIEDDEDTSVSRETTTKVVKENNPKRLKYGKGKYYCTDI